jgi:hypothetical protein
VKRRSLYGTAVLGLITAGLLVAYFVAPLPLTDYEEESYLFGKSVVFLHEEKEVFPVSVICPPLPEPGNTLLIVNLGDREGIRIDSVTIGIRFAGHDPGEVYLETPGSGDYPPIRFRHVTGGYGSILEIPDTGIQGDGAMTVTFLIPPRGDGATDLTVDIGAGLSETGFPWRRYEAQHRVAIAV